MKFPVSVWLSGISWPNALQRLFAWPYKDVPLHGRTWTWRQSPQRTPADSEALCCWSALWILIVSVSQSDRRCLLISARLLGSAWCSLFCTSAWKHLRSKVWNGTANSVHFPSSRYYVGPVQFKAKNDCFAYLVSLSSNSGHSFTNWKKPSLVGLFSTVE